MKIDVLRRVPAHTLPVVVACASLAVAVAAGAPPGAGGRVAAVFPPWWTSQRSFAVAASAGLPVGLGRLPFVVIMSVSGAPARASLRRAGAWLLLDPAALGGCLVPGESAAA